MTPREAALELAREWLRLAAWNGIGEMPAIPLLSALPGPDGVGEVLAKSLIAADREMERMRVVVAAAVAWRHGRNRNIVGTAPSGGQRSETGRALIDAIDALHAPTSEGE